VSRLQLGTPRLGWKVGINDPVVQRMLGLDGFVVGALDGAHRLADGERYRLPAGARVCVETEVAVCLAHDVDSRAGAVQALASVGALAPAIEIVDYARPSNGLAALLSHSIFHAASVIGAPQPAATFAGIEGPLPVLSKNGARERECEPSLRIADLGTVIARVAAILAVAGERVRAGDWILTGSWVAPVPVTPGDSVEADFGALGHVGVSFDG
jgi:2-oxo-hept-3-ene-1,7-dioate hydratase